MGSNLWLVYSIQILGNDSVCVREPILRSPAHSPAEDMLYGRDGMIAQHPYTTLVALVHQDGDLRVAIPCCKVMKS